MQGCCIGPNFKYLVLMFWIFDFDFFPPKDEALAFKLGKFGNLVKNLHKSSLFGKRSSQTLFGRQQRQIERSVCFFYWTTTDKLEFTDWSQVNRMNGCGENAIFR